LVHLAAIDSLLAEMDGNDTAGINAALTQFSSEVSGLAQAGTDRGEHEHPGRASSRVWIQERLILKEQEAGLKMRTWHRLSFN